jgi:DNA-binding CsgD family transcriptional regulator
MTGVARPDVRQNRAQMKSGARAERTRLEMIRLCHSSLDSRTLRSEMLERLHAVIPFEASFFSTTDPATLLFTSSLLDFSLPTWARVRLIENELLDEDFNKLRLLHKRRVPVGVLSEQTEGDLYRSPRFREVLTPLALGDEMRGAFVANGACWGTLCLHRERAAPVYTPAEAAFFARLTPHIAEGLRKALLLQHLAEHPTGPPAPEGPGVLILTDDLSTVSRNPAAEHWLAEVAEAECGDKQAIPHSILTVVARLQALERGLASEDASATPKARLLTPSGQWLMVSASRLAGDGECGQVAILFEVARPAEIAPLIMQAYRFTKREGEVTHLVLQGCATTEIAATLRMSAHTVQDHLKAIFDKVEVRSRRELAARIFTQHYQPYLQVEDAYQPPFRAAPVDASGRLASLGRFAPGSQPATGGQRASW